MATTKLTQATINSASYKELQAFAKDNGMQSSGKGITAEFLRNQLLALIATEEPKSDSVSVGDLEITKDNAPSEIVYVTEAPVPEVPTPATESIPTPVAEETPVPTSAETKKVNSEKIKLLLLVRKDGVSHWELESKEVNKLKRNPFSNGKLLEVANRIIAESFLFTSTQDTLIKGNRGIEPKKLEKIIVEVMAEDMAIDKVRSEYLYIQYLRQEKYIAKANLGTMGTKYVLGSKLNALVAR